jgi:hypothetical protein
LFPDEVFTRQLEVEVKRGMRGEEREERGGAVDWSVRFGELGLGINWAGLREGESILTGIAMLHGLVSVLHLSITLLSPEIKDNCNHDLPFGNS